MWCLSVLVASYSSQKMWYCAVTNLRIFLLRRMVTNSTEELPNAAYCMTTNLININKRLFAHLVTTFCCRLEIFSTIATKNSFLSRTETAIDTTRPSDTRPPILQETQPLLYRVLCASFNFRVILGKSLQFNGR